MVNLDESKHKKVKYEDMEVIKTVDESGEWKAKVVTEIVPFQEFFRAEEYHQKYLVKNRNGYTCHYVRPLGLGEKV